MHQVAFKIGSFTIYWYGILVALGFILGLWTASRRALKANIAPEKIIDLGPWLIVGAVVGSRALYVLNNWQDYFAQRPWWEIFQVRTGLVFYGGLVGAGVCGLFYVRWKKLPFLKVADVLSPSIALGHVFGRLGCLMTGCCYGKPTQCSWAIHFPNDHETAGVGVHPTQLYEAGSNALLFLALAWLYRKRKFDGQVFAIYLMAYAILRGTIEFFRGDYTVYYLGGRVTPGQLVSIVIFILGATLYTFLVKKGKGSAQTA